MQQLPNPEEWLNKQPKQLPSPDEWLKNQTPSEIVSSVTPKPIVDISKTIGANLPSMRTLAEVGVGGAATAVAGPIAGSAGMALTHELFEPNKSIINVLKNTALNELGGRILNAPIVGVKMLMARAAEKAAIKSGGTTTLKNISQDLLNLEPTASQIQDSHVLHIIENVFGGTSKLNTMIKSGELSEIEATKMVQNLTGRSDISLNTLFKQATNIEKDITSQYSASKFESNKRSTGVSLIAQANGELIPIYEQTISQSNVLGPNGLPLPPTISFKQTGTEIVKGRVNPNTYLQMAKDILKELSTSDKVPDPDSPLIKDLNSIIKNNTMLDASGNEVFKPRNFKDAWQSKQDWGSKAFEDPKTLQDRTSIYYQRLYKSLTKDMDSSIQTWQFNASDASQLWKEVRQIVDKRYDLFGAKPTEKIINISETPESLAVVDNIIKQPDLLKKTLVAGHLQIPDGTGFKYVTSNLRKDLQGYEISQLFNRAKITDAKGNVSYNGQKLLDMFADPTKQESYKALFSANNRADFEQFFKNIARTNEKGQMGASPYMLLRLGGAGLGFGAGITSGIISGSLPVGAMTSGATIVGGTLALNKVAKLLTNPDTARLMVAAAQNSSLGMPVKFAGRAIANVLKNTPFTVEYSDGSKVEGKIDATGKFTIPVDLGKEK